VLGHDLTRMLRAGMPRGWTAGERCVALILADVCNDRTRRPPAGLNPSEILCEELSITPGTLGNILASLARKGCEFRVPFGRDKHGRPVYAAKGHAVEYAFPMITPRDAKGPLLGGPNGSGLVETPPAASFQGPFSDGPSLPKVHSPVAKGPPVSGPHTPITPSTKDDADQDSGVPVATTSVEGGNDGAIREGIHLADGYGLCKSCGGGEESAALSDGRCRFCRAA
jgi:hypothetical protein